MSVNNFNIGRMIGSERTGGVHWLGLIAMIATSLLVSYSDASCNQCISCQGLEDSDTTVTPEITSVLAAAFVTTNLADPVAYTDETNYGLLKTHFGAACDSAIEGAAAVGDTKCVSMVVNKNEDDASTDFSCQIRTPMSDLYNKDTMDDTQFAEELNEIDDTAMTEALEGVDDAAITAAVFLCDSDNCNNEAIADDVITLTAVCTNTHTLCDDLATAMDSALEDTVPVTVVSYTLDEDTDTAGQELPRSIAFTIAATHKWFADDDDTAVATFFNGIAGDTPVSDASAEFAAVANTDVQITPAELPTTTTTTTSTTTTEATTTDEASEEPVSKEQVTVTTTFTGGTLEDAENVAEEMCTEMLNDENFVSCTPTVTAKTSKRARRNTVEWLAVFVFETVAGAFDDTSLESAMTNAFTAANAVFSNIFDDMSIDDISDFIVVVENSSAVGVNAHGLVNMIAIIVPIFAYCSFWRQ